MVFGAVAGLATSALGAAVGYSEGNKARKAAQGLNEKAQGKVMDGRHELRAGIRGATPFMDELLGLSTSLEDDLLAQTDPILAREVFRIQQEEQAAAAEIDQGLISRGLDNFTVRQSMQGQSRARSQGAFLDAAARNAAVRSEAIARGRSAAIAGLGARADFEVTSGRLLNDSHVTQAQLYANTQVQGPSGVGAGIGALAGGFMDIYRTQALADAWGRVGGGGGAGAGSAASMGSLAFLGGA